MLAVSLNVLLVLGVFGAVLGHLVIAYIIAPKRAKQGILDALTDEPEFGKSIMAKLLEYAVSEIEFDIDGKTQKIVPFNSVMNRAISEIKAWMSDEGRKQIQDDISSYFEALKAQTANVVDTAIATQAQTTNPLVGMLVSAGVPKKYIALIATAAQMFMRQQ